MHLEEICRPAVANLHSTIIGSPARLAQAFSMRHGHMTRFIAYLKLRLHPQGDGLISGKSYQGYLLVQRPLEGLTYNVGIQILACEAR